MTGGYFAEISARVQRLSRRDLGEWSRGGRSAAQPCASRGVPTGLGRTASGGRGGRHRVPRRCDMASRRVPRRRRFLRQLRVLDHVAAGRRARGDGWGGPPVVLDPAGPAAPPRVARAPKRDGGLGPKPIGGSAPEAGVPGGRLVVVVLRRELAVPHPGGEVLHLVQSAEP